jgi:iron complex outermembrane receptor protein
MPSLIFKPRADVTTYVTYASSLQQGDLAPSGSLNQNQGLPPYRSTQLEAGVKVTGPAIDYTVAVFRLERPFARLDTDNVYKTIGQQVNNGIEGTVIGKISRDLKIYSGLTLLDPKMKGTGNAATEGMQYVGMPKLRANVLLEWAVPPAPGLVGTLDCQYVARRPGNDPNTTWAPSYTVIDLGARYASRILGKATTWRLAVDNLTNRFYWSTIGPSNLTGAVSGNMTAHLGAPRTVAASMSVNF